MSTARSGEEGKARRGLIFSLFCALPQKRSHLWPLRLELPTDEAAPRIRTTRFRVFAAVPGARTHRSKAHGAAQLECIESLTTPAFSGCGCATQSTGGPVILSKRGRCGCRNVAPAKRGKELLGGRPGRVSQRRQAIAGSLLLVTVVSVETDGSATNPAGGFCHCLIMFGKAEGAKLPTPSPKRR
jgi:hypothetical protein